MGTVLKLFLLGLCSLAVAFTKDYVTEVRQNFEEKSNSDLISQMAAFHRASLVYMAYASYFDRGDINLPGFRKFFLAASDAAFKDAQKVMDYINLRGGHQQFPLIDICHFVLRKDPSASLKKKKKGSYPPKSIFSSVEADDDDGQSSQDDWQHGLMGLSDALLMERALNKQLLDLVKGATQRGDRHLRHTVEDTFLTQQTERIKKLADVITRLRLYTEQDYPLGEYVIDLEMDK